MYVSLLFIHDCIYNHTGKREDLWQSCVKRPKVFKCLGAYMSINLSAISVKSVDKVER